MPTDLDAVLTKLELDPSSLTHPETALLAAALRTLASSQVAILRLERLLAIHGESGERLDAILSGAAATLDTREGSPAPGAGFDPALASKARSDLARRVEDARTGREVLLAALVFARDLARLP